jgi:iron complex outermembrane receptor protein
LKLSADTELYGELGASRNTVKTTIQPAPVSDVFQLPAGNPQIQTFRNFANNTTMTGGAYAGQTLASALEGIYGPNGGGAYGPNVAQFLSGWSTIVVLPTSAYYPHQFVADGKLSGLVDGDPLIARYRTFDNGLRSIKDENTGYRAVVGLKGVIAGFDYDIGFATAQSENKEYTTDGYAQLSKLLPLLNSGVVNLFGPNTPDVLAQIKATNFNGLAFSSKTNTTGIDGKISKEIAELENGPVNFAAGLAYRQEKYDFTASEATMTGDVSGYGGNYLPVSKSRDVTSAYAEVSAPIVKKLEADLAVRYDNYAGVGNTTNPKVSLRWQPVQQVLVRGAYGTGFRAPSLTNLYAPQVTGVTQNGVSDPLADCSTGNTRDCSTQFALATGGNANLKPEKSESKTLGMFFEPNKDFHVGFDVFDIKVKDQIVIGNISYLYYLGSPALAQQYSYLITRDAQGHIISLNGINANIGTTRTNGIDVDAKARFASSLGKFTFALNGTYVNKYELSRPDGTVSALADANAVIDQANGPVLPRWKHVASLTLDSAPWSVTLIDNFQSGYHDLISDFGQDGGHIGAYETFDLQGSYTGFKDLTITAGVRNLLDKNPPYSNTGGQVYFQAGYDAGYGDPRGRFVYLALNWKIK